MCIAENGTLSSATESCDTPPQTKVKRVRMTAHGSQTVRQAQNEKLSNYKIAFKHATTVYSREKEKKGGMSAQDVSDLIKNQIKESISAQMIQRNVKNGQVGSSPIRRGPKGSIPEINYKNLLMAFKSFVVINHLNGMVRETRHKKLALRVHQVLHTHTPAGSEARDFLKRVLRDSAVNFNAAKGKTGRTVALDGQHTRT